MTEYKHFRKGQQVLAGGRVRWVDSIDRKAGVLWLKLTPDASGAQCFAMHSTEVIAEAPAANSPRAALMPRGDEDEE